MNGIIWSVLNLFGITQVPTTVQEFLWDLVILFVGITIVKAVLAFIFGFFKDAGKLSW